jgi:hypothetical protein
VGITYSQCCCFPKTIGSATHSDTNFSREGVLVILMAGKKVPEQYSSVFHHKNTLAYRLPPALGISLIHKSIHRLCQG